MSDEVKPLPRTFDSACSYFRGELKALANGVLTLRYHPYFSPQSESNGVSDNGEMIANIMLAYRHLEDATMRLGKAIQAYDGGQSVYDK